MFHLPDYVILHDIILGQYSIMLYYIILYPYHILLYCIVFLFILLCRILCYVYFIISNYITLDGV